MLRYSEEGMVLRTLITSMLLIMKFFIRIYN